MDAVLIQKPTRSRRLWLETRRRGIGGSDVSAMVGLNQYKSPYVLWLDKRGLLPEDETSEAAKWGNTLEPIVAREFRRRTQFRVLPTPGTLQHPEHEWMLVNPDRLVCDGRCSPGNGVGMYGEPICDGCAVLECKTTSQYKADEWEDDELPYHAALQIQWALAVTGLKRAYAAGLIGGQSFKVVPVDRDDDLIAVLIAEGEAFWRRVVENDPPEIDGRDSTVNVMKSLYNVDPDKVIDLPDISDLVKRRTEAMEVIKTAEEDKQAAENAIRDLMGDAEVGMVGDRVAVTWKSVERKESVTAASTYRKLHFKKEKKTS